MGVFLTKDARVVVQGITGNEGSFWTEKMIESGTNVVAGVTPGKGGERVHGVPVYNAVREAVRDKGANTSVIYVPPMFCKDACLEALDAGCTRIVVLADGVPVQDTIEMKTMAKEKNAMVIGPNTSGVSTIGVGMLGFMPMWLTYVFSPGPVGVVTRSGSLTNEVCSFLVKEGLGETSTICCGGDPVPGTRFADIALLFEADPDTKALLMVGEPGGSMEEEVVDLVKAGRFTKPIVAFLAGRTAPPEKRMGHAGAIVSGGKGTIEGKTAAIEGVGGVVIRKPCEAGTAMAKLLRR